MKEKLQKILNRATTVFTVFCVILCLVICTKVILRKDVSVLGFRVFHIVTGSMEPTIRTGGLVVVKETGFYDLEVDDIITFYSRNPILQGAANTHRIVAVEKDAASGQLCFVTKGDANPIEDDERVYPEDIIGKVVYYSNMNGFSTFINFVRTLPGFLTVIVMPMMLVAFWIMKSFAKEMDRITRERVRMEMELEEKEAADAKALQTETGEQSGGQIDEIRPASSESDT